MSTSMASLAVVRLRASVSGEVQGYATHAFLVHVPNIV